MHVVAILLRVVGRQEHSGRGGEVEEAGDWQGKGGWGEERRKTGEWWFRTQQTTPQLIERRQDRKCLC